MSSPRAVWLFRVFDAFNVRGNGWVLLPGVLRADPRVAVGDLVELRGGRGPARRATIKAVGAFAPADVETAPLLVELEPTQRPQVLNAEVWKVPRD